MHRRLIGNNANGMRRARKGQNDGLDAISFDSAPFVLKSEPMRDGPGASEWRTQLVATICIVAVVRGLMETAWVFAARQVSWHVAFGWTLASWLLLAPLAAGTVLLTNRFQYEHRTRLHSIVVHFAS